MKSLAVYLKEYKKESILAPLFKLLEVVFDLLVPVVVAQIIDVGVAQDNRSFCIDLNGGSRTCLQFHRTVFCCEGKLWICGKIKTGNV